MDTLHRVVLNVPLHILFFRTEKDAVLNVAYPKDANDFHKHKIMKIGLSPICKDCNYSAAIKRRYGIDLQDYQRILESQNGKCEICNGGLVRNRKRFDIDHCHTTGKVRGLLCSNCNRAIGLLRDNVRIAEKMVEYLQKGN